jgi:hypothetical protein
MALLIAAGLALAVPVIAITAAPRGQAPTLAAGASASAEASDGRDKGPKKDKTLKGNKGLGRGNGQGNGNGGLKGNGSPRGPITIRAISGSQVSLATEDGWSRTITVTPTTVITKGGQPIAVGDVAERLAGLAVGAPIGRVDDLGGPEVLTFDEAARAYLSSAGRKPRTVHVPVVGKLARSIAEGGLTCPDHAHPGLTFRKFLNR